MFVYAHAYTLPRNLGEEEHTKVDALVVKDFLLPEFLTVSALAIVEMTYRYMTDFREVLPFARRGVKAVSSAGHAPRLRSHCRTSRHSPNRRSSSRSTPPQDCLAVTANLPQQAWDEGGVHLGTPPQ